MLKGVPFLPAVQTSRSVGPSSAVNRAGSCRLCEMTGTVLRLLPPNLLAKLDRSASPGIAVTEAGVKVDVKEVGCFGVGGGGIFFCGGGRTRWNNWRVAKVEWLGLSVPIAVEGTRCRTLEGGGGSLQSAERSTGSVDEPQRKQGAGRRELL